MCFNTKADAIHWEAGLSLLQDWYVTHSVRDRQIGFVPYKNSWRTQPQKDSTESLQKRRSFTEYNAELSKLNKAPPAYAVAILLSASGLSFLAMAFYFTWKICVKIRPSANLN